MIAGEFVQAYSLGRLRAREAHKEKQRAHVRAVAIRCWRSLPPSSAAAATAAVDQVKKKSAAARPKARPGFAAPLGSASGRAALDVHRFERAANDAVGLGWRALMIGFGHFAWLTPW